MVCSVWGISLKLVSCFRAMLKNLFMYLLLPAFIFLVTVAPCTHSRLVLVNPECDLKRQRWKLQHCHCTWLIFGCVLVLKQSCPITSAKHWFISFVESSWPVGSGRTYVSIFPSTKTDCQRQGVQDEEKRSERKLID